MSKIYPIDATLSDVVNKKCPILCAMDLIGSKWKLPIVRYLHEKPATRIDFRAAESRRIFVDDFGVSFSNVEITHYALKKDCPVKGQPVCSC
ncbi:MAG: hypothetical protein IJ774_14015 [Selenomonadaceae bacterium]|nr:hypothetical protein [Selenomonadaceae bacterium]